MKKLTTALLTGALSLILAACGNGNQGASDTAAPSDASAAETAAVETAADITAEPTAEKPTVIKVGVVGENNEDWDDVIRRFKEGEGIDVELVHFTEYTQPNEALAAGDIDLNSFQHKIFLNNYIQESGQELVSIGDTVLAPIGLFSSQIKSVDEIKDGDRIAIPNDVTNEARALFLLQTAGLIKVNGNPGEPITLDDIAENPKNLEITELDASQTARALDDVTASVINNAYATNAGLNPIEDSIFLEPVDDNSEPYVNIIAARPEDQDNPWYQKLVKEYYQTPETEKVLAETSKGSSLAAWKSLPTQESAATEPSK
ncbi:MAG: MetQ/NlpA family ABC transporter substrate-binding protein [Peptoniphilaceae bacterium]|nr:MetQ/NlpA family ABC transporter substrate-binding protein [Peptoniphilaceae bacterium]MDY6085682.1 MetQ/NlpA family ABC transporter substrate-binding protein [Peptoniphilaceae bacterium]